LCSRTESDGTSQASSRGLLGKLPFPYLLFAIFILALVLRFAFLDLKLLHHDEAIHAWFSYELLTKGTYAYDPMYHGPFLYYITAGMFSLFGQSDLVARLLPALFGSLLIPLVYALYGLKYLDEVQTLVASLFIAISPDLIYFSRFLRHDVFQLTFALCLIVALLAYLHKGETRYALLAAVGAGGMLACKEDAPLLLVIIAVYSIVLIARRRLILPKGWKIDLALALTLTTAILVAFYSSFWAHPEILISGVEKAWTHWTAMHGQCRICGPPYFYILFFFLYEAPIFLLGIVGAAQILIFRGATIPLTIRLPWRRKELPECIDPQIDGTNGPIPPVTVPKSPPVWTRKDEFFLFCLFWLVVSLAAYSYIGEKVPWLIIHQLLPLIFVAVYMMNKIKTVVAIASCIFLVLATWHVAFVPYDINEPIVQVQNSEEMRTVMAMIDASGTVMIASKDYWPLPWYYRGGRWEKMRFYGGIVEERVIDTDNPDLIITHDLESFPSLDGFEKRTYRLCYWFSYYDNQDRLPEYYFLRDGKIGSINIDVFVKNGSAAEGIR
jgi:uncharacterized protein (TIGR03663 family)